MDNIIKKTPLIFNDNDLPAIWVNDFSPDTAIDFSRNLLELSSDPDTSEIFVYITSYGGEIFPALSMVEMMLTCKKPVHTIGTGLCASAGALMLMCGTGKRWIGPNSFLHIHYLTGGDYTDSPAREQDLKQSLVIEERMFTLMTKRSKITVKQLKKHIDNEKKEWQITPREAIKYGFVDKIGVPTFNRYTVTEYK